MTKVPLDLPALIRIAMEHAAFVNLLFRNEDRLGSELAWGLRPNGARFHTIPKLPWQVPARAYRHPRWLLLVALIPIATFLAYVATSRTIQRDEGFYLMDARLVLNGKAPYLDFFYPQAPLLPYVYALWMRVAGAS
jgi:hypothetical protein